MARSMNLDVLVRLRDRFTGPMRRLKDNLKSLANVGRQIGVIGTAVAAISFIGPIREAAAFQQQLLDIAGTAELTGKAAFDFARKTGREYEELALKIGQASDVVASGAGGMIAAGVDSGVINRNIETIGRAATATNAEFSDMTAVATSLLKTLNVPESELEGALASLVVAGKEGAFELKDMAKYFSLLTSQMKKFGVTGRDAVDFLGPALQIAKTGASDPSVAANNLNNFLAKALAPVTQKNFKAMGVDIEGLMMKAVADGLNPVEAMITEVGRLTGVGGDAIGKYMRIAEQRGLKGGEALEFVREQLEAIGAAGKVGELFGDQQVLDFLIPMLANLDEYERIKAEVSAATGEVIDKDFDTQIEGLNRQLTILGEIGTQAIRFVGFAFGEWLPVINENLMAMLAFVRQLDDATGGWVSKALVAAGGGLLFAGALGALGLALPVVIAGFSALASIVAIALGPIGLAIGLLAGSAVYIGKNWDRYGPLVMRLWDRTKRGFSDFADGVMERGGDIVRSGRELVDRYGPAVREGIGRAWESVSGAATTAWAAMPDVSRIMANMPDFSQLADRLPSFETIKTTGLEILADVLERLRAVRDFALSFFSEFAAGFSSGFAGSDFSQADTAANALDLIANVIERLKQVGAGAIERIKLLLEALGGFFTGFGGESGAMGEAIGLAFGAIGETISNITGLISDLTALGSSGGTGIDWTSIVTSITEFLGMLTGKTVTIVANNINGLASAISKIVEVMRAAVAYFAEGKPIPWDELFPSWVAERGNVMGAAIDWVGRALQAVLDFVTGKTVDWYAIFPESIAGSITAIADAIQSVVGALSSLAEKINSMPSLGNLGGAFGGGVPSGGAGGAGAIPKSDFDSLIAPRTPANTNTPQKQSSVVPSPAARPTRQLAAAQAPARADVSGTIRIAVDGPGKVTSATSSNRQVAMASSTGRRSNVA